MVTRNQHQRDIAYQEKNEKSHWLYPHLCGQTFTFCSFPHVLVSDPGMCQILGHLERWAE